MTPTRRYMLAKISAVPIVTGVLAKILPLLGNATPNRDIFSVAEEIQKRAISHPIDADMSLATIEKLATQIVTDAFASGVISRYQIIKAVDDKFMPALGVRLYGHPSNGAARTYNGLMVKIQYSTE